MDGGRLGLVGYGEVGGIFGAGLAGKVSSVHTWDTKLANPAAAIGLRDRAQRDGVVLVSSAQQLCAVSDLVISAVTASNTIVAARESAAYLRPGTVFLDLNSASPGAKKAAASVIEASGGQYVEAAVMASVPPLGVKVPILLGGPHAKEQEGHLRELGLNVTAVSSQLGSASAIKMCRSVIIKGLEALVIECFTTARAYGVEEHVLQSLHNTFPTIDWAGKAGYFYSRVVKHGRRRAEEMREVSDTVREAGFDPLMAAATAKKQDWVADLASKAAFEHMQPTASWQAYADRVIQTSGEARSFGGD